MWKKSVWVMACMAIGLHAWAFEFNNGDREGWTSGNYLDSIECTDGNLVLQVGANAPDPFVNGPAGSWDADQITGIEFRIRLSADPSGYGGAAMYYFPTAGQHGSFDYEIFYPGEWNIVYIDFLSATGGDSPMPWAGDINRIRLDFPNNIPENYTVEIDWIRFVDDRILNNNFEYAGLSPWVLEGQGTLDSFRDMTDEYFSEVASVEVTGLGSDKYHALSQDIRDGLTVAKGQQVSVVGAVKIPKESWDADSVLWFRVREYDGSTENLSPVTEVTVFDEWFQFESVLELKFEPAARKELKVQLYSKNPVGKKFYFDDIFVDIRTAAVKPIENPGWPVNAVKVIAGQTIVIDGQVSAAEYQGAQALIMNKDTLRGIADPYFPNLNHNGNITNTGMLNTSLDDFNATYYFMWDSQFFYAAVSVQDDHYSFVGPDPNGSDTLQFVFAVSPDVKKSGEMYIPTIAPQDASGKILGKNNFGGWIEVDIMAASEFAGSVNPTTQDWTVEIQIPWSAMKGVFSKEVFPPQAGEVVGFSVLAIDYDNGALEWFSSNHSSYPWESLGVESLYFVESQTAVPEWFLY